MTASNSSSLILWKKRSRRMPALFTTPSMRPKVSSAEVTMRAPLRESDTLSAGAAASLRLDRVDGLLPGAGIVAFAAGGRPDVVGDHAGAGLGQGQCDVAAD